MTFTQVSFERKLSLVEPVAKSHMLITHSQTTDYRA